MLNQIMWRLTDSWKFKILSFGREVGSGSNHTGVLVKDNWDTQMWMKYLREKKEKMKRGIRTVKTMSSTQF